MDYKEQGEERLRRVYAGQTALSYTIVRPGPRPRHISDDHISEAHISDDHISDARISDDHISDAHICE
jgi:hypothetical protein